MEYIWSVLLFEQDMLVTRSEAKEIFVSLLNSDI